MPAWTSECEARLLLALFQGLGINITRENCAKISEAMDGEFSGEAIRQHIMAIKRKGTATNGDGASSNTATAKSAKKDNSSGDRAFTKKASSSRKRSPAKDGVSDIEEADKSTGKVKKEEDETVTNFVSFFDQEGVEIWNPHMAA